MLGLIVGIALVILGVLALLEGRTLRNWTGWGVLVTGVYILYSSLP